MNVTVALFDRWKAAKNVESDRAALRLLGLSSGAAVHWRKGREAGADVLERLVAIERPGTSARFLNPDRTGFHSDQY